MDAHAFDAAAAGAEPQVPGRVHSEAKAVVAIQYDGQVSWDDTLDPSFEHDVTTVIMGNCDCGFAPVAPGGEARLIDVMEGVEDIPGTALYEGVPWALGRPFPNISIT